MQMAYSLSHSLQPVTQLTACHTAYSLSHSLPEETQTIQSWNSLLPA